MLVLSKVINSLLRKYFLSSPLEGTSFILFPQIHFVPQCRNIYLPIIGGGKVKFDQKQNGQPYSTNLTQKNY